MRKNSLGKKGKTKILTRRGILRHFTNLYEGGRQSKAQQAGPH